MYFFIIVICLSVMKTSANIPNSLHNYIKSSDRLEKYSITILLEYEKNSTERFLEEKLYLRKELPNLPTVKLRKELNIASCDNRLDRNFSLSILEILQDILQFSVKSNIITKDDNDVLVNETFDLILCQPKINNTLYQSLYPVQKLRYVLIYKPSNISINQDIFVLTFAGTLWFCFALIIILLALCLNFTSKKYSKIYGHPSWGTVDITFWGIAAACQQGLSTTPTGFASRLIFLLGYLTSYLLYTGFAAAITSLLVQNNNFVLQIKDIERMKLNVGVFGNINKFPTKFRYLVNGRNFKTIHSFLFYINEEKSVGIVEKKILERYFTSEEKMFDYCNFVVAELENFKYHWSFLIPKSSEYKSVFNYWLIRLEQIGLLNLASEHSKPNLPTCETFLGYSSATLDHVTSANLLIFAGIGASLVFLTMECLWNGYRHRKTRS